MRRPSLGCQLNLPEELHLDAAVFNTLGRQGSYADLEQQQQGISSVKVLLQHDDIASLLAEPFRNLLLAFLNISSMFTNLLRVMQTARDLTSPTIVSWFVNRGSSSVSPFLPLTTAVFRYLWPFSSLKSTSILQGAPCTKPRMFFYSSTKVGSSALAYTNSIRLKLSTHHLLMLYCKR